MQASRHKGSVSDKEPTTNNSTTTTTRSQTPSRQFADRKSNTSTTNKSSAAHTNAARSSSTPKQRHKNNVSGGASASTPLPAHDAALAKMTQVSAGKNDAELQQLLQHLLQTSAFRDAAYLIAASPALSARFKTSDVVRLMLDAKQFTATAELIRAMALQTNQLLVTLFVKELVRSTQFHAAVRYAQEFVQNFGKRDFGPREHDRPSWTPQALIQAMVRAGHYKTALKFAKQFELLPTFAALPLVRQMLESRQFDDAVSSVMEFRLFSAFPLDQLVATLLSARQWSLAAKCIGKLSDAAATKQQALQCADALVRAAAQAGDFVTALRYVREFKRDDALLNRALLEDVVDAMITFSELYKAIKYAIKFGLDSTTAESVDAKRAARFTTPHLIRHAIASGQTHVALFYIKKLQLRDVFTAELNVIDAAKQQQLRDFHEFVAYRTAQSNQPSQRAALDALLGADAVARDAADWIELEPVTRDVVVSETIEVLPPRLPRAVENTTTTTTTMTSTLASVDGATTTLTTNSSVDERRPDGERQSRFNFARTNIGENNASMSMATTTSTTTTTAMRSNSSSALPPPGLALFGASTDIDDAGLSSSFNFAAFATAPPAAAPGPPGLARMNQQQQSMPMMQSSLHGATPNMMYAPPSHQHQQPQQQHRMMASGPFGASMPLPLPSASLSSQFAPSFHHQQHYPTPPPPPPSLPSTSSAFGSSSGGFPSMDIASLAMQFHSSGQPVFGNNNGGLYNGSQLPLHHPHHQQQQQQHLHHHPQQQQQQYHHQQQQPPLMTGAPPAMNHLFPSFAPPPPPPSQFAPPPPRPSFKPSIGYTSVTTTRQKR